MKIEKVSVGLAGRSYDITIGRGVSALLDAELEARRAAGNPIAFVSEENVWENFAKKPSVLPDATIVVENGEKAKNLRNFEAICRFFAQSKIDRSGCVFAFGGGVVGDLAGFAAASYMRGIDFCQVPTTLLAMVDSSVGGKTGVNIEEGKNLVGAFHQPKAVFADTSYLDTLPPREFAAGMAEVVKCALLGDFEFFEMLEGLDSPLSPAHPKMPEVIARCCRMKAEIVSGDERETNREGGRVFLNLGHTFAHAVEKCAGYGEYLHGEAVGLGLVLAARLSEAVGEMAPADAARVVRIVEAYGLPSRLRSPIDADALVSAVKVDKKTLSGLPRFVVMRGIGRCAVRADIPLGLAKEIFQTAL